MDARRHRDIALVLELRDRLQAVRLPGIADDEHRIARLDARAPPEVVRRLIGPIVLVHPQEREVEVVARVREVVRVAAEEAQLHLGRHDQADVREPAEHVGRVAASVVQTDHLHPDRVPARSVFGLQLRLDLRDDLGSDVIAVLFGRRVRRREHLVRDVLHLDQLVRVVAGNPSLVRKRSGDESIR